MGKIDRTFDPICAYGSEHWCAARVGVGYDSWRKTVRAKLEQDGFPPRDPITGLTIKEDVDAWIAKRRRVSDPSGPPKPERSKATANLAAL